MIDKIELKEIPFVDGLPNENQERIDWIKQGECADGALSKTSNEGSLNRSGVQIQKNIVELNNNDFLIEGKISEVIDVINAHSEALSDIAAEGILETLNNLDTSVEALTTNQQLSDEKLKQVSDKADFVEGELGEYDPLEDSEYRPVRKDIVFLKTTVGAYPDEDFNGLPVPGAEGSGLKRRVVDTAKAGNKNTQDILEIQEFLRNSKIAEAQEELNSIRLELGPKENSKPSDVYSRLDIIEEEQETAKSKIDSIEENLSSGTIATSIKELTDQVEENSTKVDKAGLDIESIDTKIGDVQKEGSIISDVAKNTKAVETLNSELVKTNLNLDEVKTLVGFDPDPDPTSLLGKVDLLTDTVNDVSNNLQEIQSEIGDSKTGLKGAVVLIGTTLDGTDPDGTTFEEIGVAKASEIAWEQSKVAVPQAPSDGSVYVMVDQQWKPLPSSVGVFYKNNVTLTTTAEYQEILTPNSYIAERCSYLDGINIADPGIYEIKVSSVLDRSSVENISFQIKAETISEGGTKHVDTFVLEDIVRVKDKVQIFVKSTDENFGEYKTPQVKVQIKPIR
ncbi:fibritin protein [Providencia phage PSTCR6]|nr:fibritin protein [Providencia phage PSTCR6]